MYLMIYNESGRIVRRPRDIEVAARVLREKPDARLRVFLGFNGTLEDVTADAVRVNDRINGVVPRKTIESEPAPAGKKAKKLAESKFDRRQLRNLIR